MLALLCIFQPWFSMARSSALLEVFLCMKSCGTLIPIGNSEMSMTHLLVEKPRGKTKTDKLKAQDPP